jgi:hypothetical protein
MIHSTARMATMAFFIFSPILFHTIYRVYCCHLLFFAVVFRIDYTTLFSLYCKES